MRGWWGRQIAACLTSHGLLKQSCPWWLCFNPISPAPRPLGVICSSTPVKATLHQGGRGAFLLWFFSSCCRTRKIHPHVTAVRNSSHRAGSHCLKMRWGYTTSSVRLILINRFHTARLQGLCPDCRDQRKGTILRMCLSLQKAADTQKEQTKGLWVAGIKEITRSQDYSWDFSFDGNLKEPKRTNFTLALHNTR